jgi:hypothetical protein
MSVRRVKVDGRKLLRGAVPDAVKTLSAIICGFPRMAGGGGLPALRRNLLRHWMVAILSVRSFRFGSIVLAES